MTLSIPGDSPLGLPAGRWEWQGRRIVATFTREELALAVGLALEQKRVELEARLERGLAVLDAAQVGDVDRLLAHWDKLSAEYGRVMGLLERLRAGL